MQYVYVPERKYIFESSQIQFSIKHGKAEKIGIFIE